ncbi:MAG TPA: nickel-binding protein [Gammaproteobacteria bacterium]
MPLFMDRHYTKDATRTAIELAHAKDLAIQAQHGVRFITYWFDEARHTTFCLVEAPDDETIRKVHAEAHGDVPHEIIPVDAGAVELFLGRLTDPVPPAPDAPADPESGFRVIMFTDLKDSTAMTAQLGDSDAMHLLRIHNAIVRDALRAHDGSEVKHTGDGFMVSFQDANAAVRCALAIQHGFDQHRRAHPGDKLHVRIGLSCGEPVEEDNDLFGSAVQTAARVCDSCPADQVLLDAAVCAACDDAAQWDLGESRRLELKGLRHPVDVRTLRWR